MTVHPEQRTLATEELDYDLPERLIATKPAEPRDAARLLVVHLDRDTLEHCTVRDLPELLRENDTLVLNTTAVAPARLIGNRSDTRGRMEGLFLEEIAPATWRVMLKSNSRLRAGQRMTLFDAKSETTGYQLELAERDEECWIVRVIGDDDATPDTVAVLDHVGLTPLPPYILRARGEHAIADALDRRWYQTVYADPSQKQSVAAPTAGLHFTPELLAALDARSIERLSITLHVGPGTFKPVTAATLAKHHMHSERFEISPPVMHRLAVLEKQRYSQGSGLGQRGRLIAIGTTTVRALESLPAPLPKLDNHPFRASTDLLIAPPYHFRLVEGMLTNFHLPRSTLLALVAAIMGLDRLKRIYAEAIRREYRFYSYGDAMLILP